MKRQKSTHKIHISKKRTGKVRPGRVGKGKSSAGKIARGKAGSGKIAGEIARIEASSWRRRPSRSLPPELEGMYRPVKQPITLRLDANVLAWYRRPGRGYQTRINQVLKWYMNEGWKIFHEQRLSAVVS